MTQGSETQTLHKEEPHERHDHGDRQGAREEQHKEGQVKRHGAFVLSVAHKLRSPHSTWKKQPRTDQFMNEPKDASHETLSPAPEEASWNDLADFLAVARAGGLAGASRTLSVSGPTLGRRMRALERSLGRDLFLRRTHGYDLTEDGERLRDDLVGIEAGLLQITRPSPGEALPSVRITAGTYTMMALAPRASELLGNPPDLRLRLLAGEVVLSIARREADIGFRARRPIEVGLAGRKLRDVSFAPFAAPGAPDRWIVVTADTPSARWVSERAGRDAVIQSDTPRVALDLTLAGMGRLLLPDFLGDKRPGLERVGDAVPELAHEQWIVTHADRRAQPEIRRALDRLEKVCSDKVCLEACDRREIPFVRFAKLKKVLNCRIVRSMTGVSFRWSTRSFASPSTWGSIDD